MAKRPSQLDSATVIATSDLMTLTDVSEVSPSHPGGRSVKATFAQFYSFLNTNYFYNKAEVDALVATTNEFSELADVTGAYTTAYALYRTDAAKTAYEETTTLLTEPAANQFTLTRGTGALAVQTSATIDQDVAVGASVSFTQVKGSSAASGNLRIVSTSDATKGYVYFGVGTSGYDETNDKWTSTYGQFLRVDFEDGGVLDDIGLTFGAGTDKFIQIVPPPFTTPWLHVESFKFRTTELVGNTGNETLSGFLSISATSLYGNTLSSIAGNLNLTPVAGSSVVIDGHFGFDANSQTGLTDNDTYINAYAARAVIIEGITIQDNDVTIPGNLTVSGTKTFVNTQELDVQDNVIIVNYGEIGTGVSAGYAGIRVDRGVAADYSFQFNETTDTFRVGETTYEEDTAQAGAALTITLAATTDHADLTFYNSKKIVIKEGTGKGQVRSVPAAGDNWNNTSKVLTVGVAWDTNPDNTSVYEILTVDDTRAVATREDAPTDTYLAYWDTATLMFKTTNDIPTAFTIGTKYIYRAEGTDIPLADGGTNASLTASNGGIFYSTATAGAILAGTATANQLLMSGASAAPAWSTAVYPATTTINQLLYSSAANTVTGLATAASSLLYTDAGGIPAWGTSPPTLRIVNVDNLRLNGNTLSATSGNLILEGVASASIVINEAGADVNFRVEGDTEANLLQCDAERNTVGIGTPGVLNQRFYIKAQGTTSTYYALTCVDSASGDLFFVRADKYVYVNQDIYIVNNCSALSFTDRTPYPASKEVAYSAIKSMNKKIKDGKNSVDHENMHPFIKSQVKSGNRIETGRDLSATVSCLVEIIKDLEERIKYLEKYKN